MFIIGTPHTKGAGYHRNDDTPSGGRLEENDISTCPHCQTLIKLQEWKQAPTQNFCNRCMKPTCNAKTCVEDCIPAIEQFANRQDAVIKYHQFLKLAGLEAHAENIPAEIFLP